MRSKGLEKIVINTGIGRLRDAAGFNDTIMPAISGALSSITGQKPEPRQAKKSIAGFKLREGNIVGLRVTLRGKRMYEFLERMVGVALPRVRDFKGIHPRQIDKTGNLTIGFHDHTVFPEISPEDSKADFGFQVTLVPQVKDKDGAYDAYKELGVPMKEK